MYKKVRIYINVLMALLLALLCGVALATTDGLAEDEEYLILDLTEGSRSNDVALMDLDMLNSMFQEKYGYTPYYEATEKTVKFRMAHGEVYLDHSKGGWILVPQDYEIFDTSLWSLKEVAQQEWLTLDEACRLFCLASDRVQDVRLHEEVDQEIKLLITFLEQEDGLYVDFPSFGKGIDGTIYLLGKDVAQCLYEIFVNGPTVYEIFYEPTGESATTT